VIPRPEGLLAVGDTLYFTADYGTTGTEIWTTNGAPNSARQITDIVSGKYGDSYPEYLTAMGGSLYFSAYDPEFGAELWRITGSVTERVFDIYLGKEGSMPESLVAGTTPQGQERWRKRS